MSWFGSRTSSNPSQPQQHSPNNLSKQRHKQIESLREQIPGVVEITRDEKYSVTTTTNDITLILNISLPPRFPHVGPVVSVIPPISHPWVNDQMLVDGSPLLKNFNIHSKLGRGIEQVIKEFKEHPPQVLLGNPTPYPIGGVPQAYRPPTVVSPVMSNNFSTYTYSSVPQTSTTVAAPDSPINRSNRRSAPSLPSDDATRYKCPPLPEKFEEVGKMSTEELQRYLSDTEGTVLVDEFISQLDVIKKVQVDREHQLQDNEDLAGISLNHEPEIQEGWTQLQEKFLQMEALKEEHEKKLNEQRQLIERYQQRTVMSQLKILVNEADTESEIFAEDFLEDKVPVTDFIQKYKQLRKLHHLRKTKYEKLTYGH